MSREGFGEIAERLRRSTVQIIERGRGGGSGIVWDAGGLIVTNSHVARAARVRVGLWDGRSFEGEVVTRDTRRDLATVRISAGGLPAAEVGDSDSLRPGEVVVAVGNPPGFIGALSSGVVHAQGPLHGLGRQTWVQAAVRLAPGNSGGPLANAHGRVIGLNTMIMGGGLALAIPSNAVAKFVAGASERSGPRLGIVVQPVSLGASELGLLIIEVASGSAADGASLIIGDVLRGGDVLTGADGRAFKSPDDLPASLERSTGVVAIDFLRGDRRVRRQVTVRLTNAGAAAA